MARKTRLKFGGDKFNRAIEDVQSGSVAISTASAEAIDAINDLNELIKNNMANSPYKNALRMSLMVLSLKMNSVLSNNGSIKDAIFFNRNGDQRNGGRRMTRPRLLDTFCGAGGAGMGYHRAGFEVVGVDIEPQPRYPFEFHQADALEFIERHGREFDVIHASPPCQRFSESTPVQYREAHPDLIRPTRELLKIIDKPYVIENVEGARSELDRPVMLCGTMFGLRIWRHRYFELFPFWFMSPATCKHIRSPITIKSGSNTCKTWEPILCTGGGDGKRANRKTHRPRECVATIRWAMEIAWMTQAELTQAIPPVYTEWLGKQIIEQLRLQ